MPIDTKSNRSETQTAPIAQRVAAASVGGLLGIFLLIGVGFANSDILHNAAHDTRHAGTFPCH